MRLPRFITSHLGRHLVGYVALLFALTGTSYAAATLINGSQIKPHSIAKDRLTNQAIKQLRGDRGAQGAQGLQGPTGARGPTGQQGIQGPPGLSGYVNGSGNTISVPAGSQASTGAWCPAGTQPLGGGYFPTTMGDSALRSVGASFAIQDGTGLPGFVVTMANEGGSAESFHVSVRCASVS